MYTQCQQASIYKKIPDQHHTRNKGILDLPDWDWHLGLQSIIKLDV